MQELQSLDIKVVDASENVVLAREEALDYWVQEMPKNENAKLVVYVPFEAKKDQDDLTFDPFIIFSAGGKVFPNEAADEYKQLCLAALPEKESKIEEFFREDSHPSFDAIDALVDGNNYPKLKSGLKASSYVEILMAILAPSSQQEDFLQSDKTWVKELKTFSKSILGVGLQKQKLEGISKELWNLVLFSEFAHDLPISLPSKLKDVPLADIKAKQLIHDVCNLLRKRKDLEEIYVEQAIRVSEELSLPKLFANESNLGYINTFSFEDSAYFKVFRDFLLKGNLDDANLILEQSLNSIWSAYDEERRLSWMIGRKALSIKKLTIKLESKLKQNKDLQSLVEWYSSEICELDTLHRELDKNVAEIITVSELLRSVHKYAVNAYLDFTENLQELFLSLIEKEGLTSLSISRNIDLFDRKVEPLIKSGKKTVYFLVDGMRYELARQLKSRLERASFDTDLQPSLAFIPTVTKFAMAALMPKAFSNLSLRIKGDKLEPYLSDVESSTRDSRIKYVAGIYGDKASWAWEKDVLAGKYIHSELLFVTTTEIDQAGESSPDNAQLLIEQALTKILKVSTKLKEEGYEEFVLGSDHGFVLLHEYKAGNKAEKPVGEWYLQKPRCLAGKGSTNPYHLELKASDLGVQSEVDQFLFLKNFATYEKGKQFFHEGISLQEIITPCMTFRPEKVIRKDEIQVNLTYKGKTSGEITTMRPILEIASFSQSLFGGNLDIQIEAMSGNKPVGVLTPSENVNSTTGYLEIEQGKTLKFSLAMDEEFEGEFTVFAKSPSSGLILSELTLTTNYL
ncbi:PglZ domain-containing protein [Algoriphagus limi]|uniref:PglZ domain-containing protein n=1 Tax=Algoriphagus limi TaxID=2975273 RepID=A0ABT2G0U9_9BACT|nr:PglZ domain-containing protein [Algoriphagus limi]